MSAAVSSHSENCLGFGSACRLTYPYLMPGLCPYMWWEAQDQYVYTDHIATSLPSPSPRSSLMAFCEAINTNVHSEFWFTLTWGILLGCPMPRHAPPFQPEYTLGVGADCFMGTEQYCSTLFIAYERGKNAQGSQVFRTNQESQCPSISRSRLCQGGGGTQGKSQRWWDSWHWGQRGPNFHKETTSSLFQVLNISQSTIANVWVFSQRIYTWNHVSQRSQRTNNVPQSIVNPKPCQTGSTFWDANSEKQLAWFFFFFLISGLYCL